ncbi:MAG: hypothetical protein KatS3mg006_1007 [Pyrinomonadaceae bacterium]|jgi:hypothetical protein|nr:MAG: hypothetical protein KatS3mg006_1007 [Pyrinomonadaceae bacterium]
MSSSEYQITRRVFGDTLPSRRRIVVTNIVGVDNRPFTLPISVFGFLFAFLGVLSLGFEFVFSATFLLIGLTLVFFNPGYLINVGEFYENLEDKGVGILVHETAHVWQGENSFLSFGFVINSCIYQFLKGSEAYNYEVGQDWCLFNVEQQASLIEDWFLEGESTEDSRWFYIENYVRKGIS